MSENRPLVSVVIATHNRPEYLRQAIASVLRGSYQNFEIVVTDDAGPEDNRRAAESFGDPRVGLLNDDDEWEPEFLECMVSVLDANPEVVIAFSDHWVINATGDINPEATRECTHRFKRDALRPGLHRPFYRIALIDQSVPMVAALVRRNAVELEDSPLETSSMYDFWVTYLAVRSGLGAWYVPERLARYRVHEANETSVGGAIRPAIYVYSRLVADPRLFELKPELHARLRQAQRAYGIFLLKNGDALRSRHYLIATMPNPRSAGALVLSYAPKPVRRFALSALRAR
jgi:glycosyltransferase involved in cell wall biosynthesis